MKKTKIEKGITLIALIITIVVLLILAAVAISSITNDGILSYATNAAKEYNQAVKNEQDMLQEYMNYLNNGGPGSGNGNGNGSGGTTIGDATVGTKVTSLSTINGQEYSANNPVIPTGFMPINTTTSSWDATVLADEVKKGLVISDGTSEFVWIPVAEISEMAKVTSGTDANGRTNYEGKLYDFTSTGAAEKTSYGQSTTSNREPANLTGSLSVFGDQSDNADRFTITSVKNAWDTNYYQKAFNKMVESVAEYKGFYVGRYEMSINVTSGKAESAAGATSAKDNSSSTECWWGLYEKALTYSQSGVISEMIWGCQYDAMMRWMQGNSIDVTSETPTDTSRGVVASKNETNVTGSADSNDILNNIYDILGNSDEFTQEAYDTTKRVYRGVDDEDFIPSPKNRYEDYPTNAQGFHGSRLVLYVE